MKKFKLMSVVCLMCSWLFAADIRPDHPRLFFNADTFDHVRRRAMNEENDYYNKIKAKVDEHLALYIAGKLEESKDYGQHSAWSAFVYLVSSDKEYFEFAKECIERSLSFYESCYEQRKSVNWYSHSRVHVAMAWDWLYNDLTEPKRSEYIKRLINVINNVATTKPIIPLEHLSSYREGMYGIRGAFWPIGLTAYGTGIETKLIEEWLDFAKNENLRMIEHRSRFCGDDGGGGSPTLDYMACWYPYAEWNFYYLTLSATGEDISDQLRHYTLLPNYLLWNYMPSSDGLRIHGYGDVVRSIGNRTGSQGFLHTHMSIAGDLLGLNYPDTFKLVKYLKKIIPEEDQTWRNDYFIYPFLLSGDNRIYELTGEFELDKLPLARHFEKMGQIFMCSGRQIGDVYCLFACGGDLTNHRHYDALHFSIYSNDGFLAIDSGDRHGKETSMSHLLNYYSQTVAHNCVLINQPNEPATTYWGNRLSVMDGGQHNTNAQVKAFETNKNYAYVAGDATAAYMHGGDLPEKVKLVTRQMVFLPPKHFIIFDRVNSTNVEYPKRWLLHTIDEPQINGNYFYNDHGKGRLFCKTLLPANAEICSIGGPGKEYWSAGKNWPIPVKTSENLLEMAGRWRVEVKPSQKRLEDYFLHVLEVTDQCVEKMAAAKLLKSENHYGTELKIGENLWRINFNKIGALGGKITCKGKISINKRLTQEVQPQSGIFP